VIFEVQGTASNPSYSTSASASTIVEVTIPSGSIKEISFTGDHPISRWPTGAMIPDPVWTSSGTNWPVCYTKGSALSMTVKLEVNGNLPPGQTKTVTLLADGPENLDATTTFDVTGSNTVEKTVTLTTTGTLSNMVYKATPQFNWYLICGNGANSIGSSGPHTIYVTHAGPLVTPLYDRALDKACGYINGNSNYASRVNSGIDSDLTYRPWQPKPAGYETGSGGVLRAYDDRAAQCDVNAFLLKYLLESIGESGGNVTYYWGGVNPGEGTYYHGPGWPVDAWCSFKRDRPLHDDAPANPRFTFDAMTIIGGTVYDPSHGLTGAPSFLEFAPADIDAPPVGNFSGPEDTDWDGDGIQEPAGSACTGNRSDWPGQNAVYYPYCAPAP
jgi:hypothetical protein